LGNQILMTNARYSSYIYLDIGLMSLISNASNVIKLVNRSKRDRNYLDVSNFF